MIKLYKAFIYDISDTEYEAEYKRLPDAVRRRVDRLRTKEARKCSLLGHILLRRGITELLGEKEYSVSYTENGKPVLPFCKFSIAHTDTLAVCAFSDRPIGIDAERLREVKRSDRYPFFTPNEVAFINGDGALHDERFLRLWTRKEAYVKMLGGTMSQNGSIDVLGEVENCSFSNYDLSGYIITVCERR